MKRPIVACVVILSSVILAACVPEGYVGVDENSAKTGEASGITVNSAVISGSVTPQKNMQDVIMGILYGTDASLNIENGTKVIAKENTDNSFSVTVNDLKSNTKYYYKTFIQYNGSQYGFGEIKSFSTLALDVKVETFSRASADNCWSAWLSGTVEVKTSGSFTKKPGFIYGKGGQTLEELKSNGKKLDAEFATENGFQIMAENLCAGGEYSCVAFAEVYDTVLYGDVVTFKVADYPEPVDLGLSVKWGSINLGCTIQASPDSYFFAWGETDPKDVFSYENYKWAVQGKDEVYSKYGLDMDYDLGICYDQTLLPEDDAAHVMIAGGKWATPTVAEWKELFDNCTISDSDLQYGVAAYKLTGPNGNSIYLPYVFSNGQTDRCTYWTSELETFTSSYAACAHISKGLYYMPEFSIRHRYEGLPIRPVYHP